jgi:hypothetical protein
MKFPSPKYRGPCSGNWQDPSGFAVGVGATKVTALPRISLMNTEEEGDRRRKKGGECFLCSQLSVGNPVAGAKRVQYRKSWSWTLYPGELGSGEVPQSPPTLSKGQQSQTKITREETWLSQ